MIDLQKTQVAPGLGDVTADAVPAPAFDARVQAKATEAAVKFEAFFIKQMIGQMRAGTRTLAGDEDGEGKRASQDMLDFADGLVADALAQQRAFGIADLMLKQVLPAAGLSPAPAGSPSPGKTSVTPPTTP
ncbi:flagellar biosynthesis protein FlgJ [Mitsuaria sp. GD03876]|uniref:flagellar biosynthesis protein FlgJ n=1 Tax=Mitsuaria sp. GD03876 TaxID=2975399 RepID=UPI00244C1AD3|nr:flagellar biosynthesis protein FlgJ [Mitsuaria sp. GD03876]MDH0867909.1 flagellar biosynthesis protein FlgJ [Mitsuaria sp. GD03876]